MCGIFGYAGKVISSVHSRHLHKFMCHLAHQSEVRGTHSTGFAARYDSGLIVADKLPYRGSTFCNISGKFKSLRKKMPSTFIGHTRYGTGSSPRINNNNHPFFGSRFHMVHNGVIPSWRDIGMREDVLKDMQSETDSEIILRILEKRLSSKSLTNIPLEKHIEYILDNVWGNMAIALLQLNEPNIWLFRNENPINVFHINKDVFGTEMIFFSSTEKIFQCAWDKCFGKGNRKKIEDKTLLKSNQLFRISTIATNMSNEHKKLLWYPIDVSSPFHKDSQYYIGSYGNNLGWPTSAPPSRVANESEKQFYSSVINPMMPGLGCRFSNQNIKKLRSVLSSNRDSCKITVDGMSVAEFTALNNAWRSLSSIQNQTIKNKEEAVVS